MKIKTEGQHNAGSFFRIGQIHLNGNVSIKEHFSLYQRLFHLIRVYVPLGVVEFCNFVVVIEMAHA